MSEWWTYRPSSFLLFSARTYYRLFELYNAEIWPWQAVALLVGLAILALLRKPGAWQGRTISALLAASWLWVAWAYLYSRYASINWVATYFAAAFALEALLLIVLGVGHGLAWRPPGSWISRAGIGLAIFAVTLQPLIGPLVGRSWSQVEVFAVAPDPTVVGTLGVLVLASGWPKWLLLPIAILWCLVSGATAWVMQSPDAALMPAAAALAIVAVGGSVLSRTAPPARDASGTPALD
jgi:uncharacterized protein DUF6064